MKYFLLVFALTACRPQGAANISTADSDDTSASQTAPDRYVDVQDSLAGGDEGQFEAWLNLQGTLKSNFDDVCGDTFCEGDYSDLEPLRLRCSMDGTSGVLKSCKYVFAGSYETVNPQTGSIKVTAKTFSCALDVNGVALTTFMSTLSAQGGDPAIQRPLVSGRKSIYDSLGDCL